MIYITRGQTKAGFMTDRAGKPYMLSYLSYRDSDNLLDSTGDRGREFQTCLLDGFIAPGDNFDYDTTNPTQGGGNHGRAVPSVKYFKVEDNRLTVVLPGLDYDPPTQAMGPYKKRMLAGRYPATGWDMQVTYIIEPHGVQMDVAYWITDNQPHHVYFFRPATLHLNPALFQYPLENEKKRDAASWLQAVMLDDKIQVKSTDNQVKLTFTAGIDKSFGRLPAKPYYSHRCFQEDNRMIQNQDGTADVWEAMYVIEPMTWYKPGDVLRGWGRIDLQPARLIFDLPTMIKNLFAAMKARKETKQMRKIICNDGIATVTVESRNWLLSEGLIIDNSSKPQIGGDGFEGTKVELLSHLLAMPDPIEEPPVDVPVPTNFENEVLGKLDYIIELLEK